MAKADEAKQSAMPKLGWHHAALFADMAGVASRWAILGALIGIASLPQASVAETQDWQVLNASRSDRTCRPGIGWVGGHGQILRSTNCAVVTVPHPQGIGWISPSGRPSGGQWGWYKTRVQKNVTEDSVAAFLGEICERMGADGAIAQARGKQIFFRCAEDKLENSQ